MSTGLGNYQRLAKTQQFAKPTNSSSNTGPSLSLSQVKQNSAIASNYNNNVLTTGSNNSSINNLQTANFRTSEDVLREFKHLIETTNALTRNIENSSITTERKGDGMQRKGCELDANVNRDVLDVEDDEAGDSSSSINLDEISRDISNYYTENQFNRYQTTLESPGINQMLNNKNTINNNASKYNQLSSAAETHEAESKKIQLSNQVLVRSNLDLLNANKILELELNTYSSNKIYSNIGWNSSRFDENLRNFIKSVKSSWNESIHENLKIKDQVLQIQKTNKTVFTENMQWIQKYNELLSSFEARNQKNAELEITNQANIKLLSEYEQYNKTLKEKWNDLRINLNNSNAKTENLTLWNESNQKRKIDFDTLIQTLQEAINARTTKQEVHLMYSITNLQNTETNESIILKENNINHINSLITQLENERNNNLLPGIDYKVNELESKAQIISDLDKKISDYTRWNNEINKENEELKSKLLAKEKAKDMIKNNKGTIEEIEEQIQNVREENTQIELEEMEWRERYEGMIKEQDDYLINCSN